MADLKTSIIIQAQDRFSGPAKKIAAAGGKLGKQLERTQGELAALGKQAAKIGQFGKLTSAIGKTGSEMRRAQVRTAELGRRIAATAEPAKKLQREFERARKTSDRLGRQHREQRDRLRALREELRGAGVDTRKLGDAQRKLAADIERATGRIGRIEQAREKTARAGDLALRASLVGGEISRVGATFRRFAGAPIEAAAEVGRQRGRLATLSMSESGIDEVERTGRDLGGRHAGVNLAGFIGAAYDVRSAMSALSEIDVARVTGVAAELGRAADASTEEMTSAISGAYGVFKGPLFEDLSDIEFVEKFSSQLSQAVEQFRTTGGRMEQAVKTMGAGLSLSGIAMSEQLAALGQLQTAMDPSEAGTAMRAYRTAAVEAHQSFREAGLDIAMIDEATGRLRPIADVLDDMERVFGEDLDDREAAQIKEAFGREEAVRVIDGLWASGEELRSAAGELEAATMADVRRRAQDRDTNIGAIIDRMQQKWENFLSRSGLDMESWMLSIESGFDWLLSIADSIAGRWPKITKLVVGGIGLIGLAAAPLSAIVISGAAAWWALRNIHLKLLEIGVLGGGPGMLGGKGAGRAAGGGVRGLPARIKGLGARGLAGRIGEFGKGLPGKVLGLLKGKAGLLGAGLAALSIGSAIAGEGSAGEKAARVSGDVGGIAGALGGGKLGALLGSAVLPGVGTLIGGILGSVAGGIAGGLGGSKIGGLFSTGAAPPAGLTPALAGAGAGASGAVTSGDTTIDQGVHIQHLEIHQQPGEDAGAFTERMLREIEHRRRVSSREALYDEL